MKLSNFLTSKAVISLIFGVLYFLIPSVVMVLFGPTLDDIGVTMARFMGASLIGIGLICWFYKDAEYRTIRNILLALFIADTLGLLNALIAQLGGQFNSTGWVVVLIWLYLAAGLFFFRFMKRGN